MEVNMKKSLLTLIQSALVAAIIAIIPMQSSAMEASQNTAETQNENICYICRDVETTNNKFVDICTGEAGHWTHQTCVKEWLKEKNQCGLCRQQMKTDPIINPEQIRASEENNQDQQEIFAAQKLAEEWFFFGLTTLMGLSFTALMIYQTQFKNQYTNS